MKHRTRLPLLTSTAALAALAALVTLPSVALAEIGDLEVFNGPAFYGDPPDETHAWGVHDRNRPQPPVVTPGDRATQAPPSDAIVLFDGTDLSGWIHDKPNDDPNKRWEIVDGAMQCMKGAGYIRTEAEFGDCQLHVEWAAPAEAQGDSQGRGNSGVFLMGKTEVQVLDNHGNPSYADGMAGSVYGVNPPMANALNGPGEFNSYDIIFRRPLYKDGELIDQGYFTVFVNGVLVQDHTPLEGGGGHKGRSRPKEFPEVGPLKFQDHGNPVRFRNVWYRPLPPRAAEGGTNGILTEEASAAKRAETAAAIRDHAEGLEGTDQMYRLLESLVYSDDAGALEAVTASATAYAQGFADTPADQIESKKGEIMRARDVFDYVVRFGRVPADFAPKGIIDGVVEAAGWNKK